MAANVAHPTNLRWLHLQPAVDAIWACLSEANGDWHCMNPTRELSIWEARDGSALLMAFAGDEASTLCELSVQAGAASDHLQPIAPDCAKPFSSAASWLGAGVSRMGC